MSVVTESLCNPEESTTEPVSTTDLVSVKSEHNANSSTSSSTSSFSYGHSPTEIIRHYRPRQVSEDFTKRSNPGKLREFNSVGDAIVNQSYYGKVFVVHGSNGFHPLPDNEKMRKDRLVVDTPDSHHRFNGRFYPLAQKRRALFLDGVHFEAESGSYEYDLVYGNVPNMNIKFYSEQLEKFTPEQVVDYYVTPFVANSFYKAYQENAQIVVFDGFYEKYRFPKQHKVREEYTRALDRVFDHWVSQYLPYFKTIVVIGKN